MDTTITQPAQRKPFREWVSYGPITPMLGPIQKFLRCTLVLREYIHDFFRYVRYSSTVHFGDTREKARALLTMSYHSLEKGLALRTPRPGFGQANARALVAQTTTYLARWGTDEYTSVGIGVLLAYRDHHRRQNLVLPWLDTALDGLSKSPTIIPANTCGTRIIEKGLFLASAKIDISRFLESRHSVRQFAETPVPLDLITSAVRAAQKSPSVCNRQSARVWHINNAKDVADALALQAGARGFTEQIGTVLVITSEVASFNSAGERNQTWVDGGIFAMSLMLALHSYGLVTCSLNWSKTYKTDAAFKLRFGISASESIIMLLAVGHPSDRFEVAYSWRKPIEDVLFHASQRPDR